MDLFRKKMPHTAGEGDKNRYYYGRQRSLGKAAFAAAYCRT